MRRPPLRILQLAGLLLILTSGVGALLSWPGRVTAPLLAAGLLGCHVPTVLLDWRQRRQQPPKSAEEVLRWYPKWWV